MFAVNKEMETQSSEPLLQPSSAYGKDASEKTGAPVPTYEDACFVYYEKYVPWSVHPDLVRALDTYAAQTDQMQEFGLVQDTQEEQSTRLTISKTISKLTEYATYIVMFLVGAYFVYQFLFD